MPEGRTLADKINAIETTKDAEQIKQEAAEKELLERLINTNSLEEESLGKALAMLDMLFAAPEEIRDDTPGKVATMVNRIDAASMYCVIQALLILMNNMSINRDLLLQNIGVAAVEKRLNATVLIHLIFQAMITEKEQ